MMDEGFRVLLEKAKKFDAVAANKLTAMYQPLIFKESIVDGEFDEDLFQELSIVFVKCIRKICVVG